MDARSMIEVARALRKLGVTRLDVRADGFTADFDGAPAKRVAKAPVADNQASLPLEEPGVVNDMRKVPMHVLERAYEDRLREYEP